MKKRNMKKYEYRFDVVQSTGLSKTDIFECMVAAQAIKKTQQEELVALIQGYERMLAPYAAFNISTTRDVPVGYRKLAQWGLK